MRGTLIPGAIVASVLTWSAPAASKVAGAARQCTLYGLPPEVKDKPYPPPSPSVEYVVGGRMNGQLR
jgi:hypothetical protein